MIKKPAARLCMVAGALVLGLAPVMEAAAAKRQGDLMVRLRGIAVVSDDSATISPIGGDSDIGNEYTGELDFTYFWTPNIGTELILATNKHSVMAKGTSIGDVDLGHVWLLPPTLTMQYHFAPRQQISPYVGAGINYTFFYNVNDGPVVSDVNYDNSFGWALQAGVDIEIRDNIYVNLDVKRLWLNTDVDIDAGELGMVNADVDIDPWIFGVGFGTTF